MNSFGFSRRYNNAKRYRDILSILSKYGFSVVAEKVGGGIPFRRLRSRFIDDLSRGERIKLAIEELGPTFIKLGQILSTRYDLIPEDIYHELSSLQDDVYEVPISDIRYIFKEETGMEIEEVFESFNEKPLAAASIGQVHRGKLKTGEQVVIKIQRPNIKDTINQDIQILKTMADLIDKNLNANGIINARDIIDEFSESITHELDYIHEAHSAQKIKINFIKNNTILIPKIYWEVTTKRVITMEEIKGLKVNDASSIEERGWCKEEISELVANLFMEQVFLDGVFHADPHPGNIIVVDERVIGFIDFGVVGYIDNQMLDFIITTLRAISSKNIDKIIEKLEDIDALTIDTDETGLRHDIFNIINYYFDLPMSKIDFGKALNEFLMVLYRHNLRVPSQLSLLMKAMITLEGTLKSLNPQFNLMKVSNEIINKVKKKKLDSINIKDTLKTTLDLYDTFKKIPGQMLSILNKVEKNQIKITMKQEGLEMLEKEVNNLTNKLSLSLMVSSLIVGSSIVIHADIRPKVFDVPLFGLIGYITGLIIGLWFIISAIRSRKKY